MPPSLQWICSLFVLFLLLNFFLSPAAGLCLANQSAALLQFKQGLSIQQPERFSSWRWGSDCCNWTGVTCENATGFVVALNLSGATAASPTARVFPSVSNFSSSLFDLLRLQSLDLSYNVFSGSVPTGFSKLQQLTHLNLSNSGFSGQVPAEISRMTWLVSLDLSVSYLRSPNFLSLQNPDFVGLVKNLTNLRDLRLDGVNISMSVGHCISAVASSLSSLQILSLSNCFLSGSTNGSIPRVQSISHLDLSRNNLSNIPKFLADLTELQYLGLSTCYLQGTFPPGIFILPRLQILDISNNPNVVGSIPNNFPPDSNLQILSLSSTNLGGNLPDSIGKLTTLSDLTMKNCNFTGHIPLSLVNLTRLRIVDMSFNGLSGRIPAITAPGIILLDLSSNSLTGEIPDSFGQLNNLVYLNLKYNFLTGYIPLGLLNLPNLRTLDLSQNNLTGPLSNFSNAKSLLETLDLTNNSLCGEIPPTVGSLSHIKVIALSSNEFTGTVDISPFMRLKNLSRLDLSGNILTVESNHLDDIKDIDVIAQLSSLRLSSCNISRIPKWVRTQKKLSILELGKNGISGDIPAWLWTLRNLTYLNLSHNMFSNFEKPADPVNMMSLFALDLHSNLLSGDIPSFPPSALFLDFSSNRFTSSIPINNKSSLLYLNMANNNITGNIPESLCNSAGLSVLDLSNNSLMGGIPSCLAYSTELSVLNLRRNGLSSRIPDVFSVGCRLITLNLNGNQLSGDVPRSLCHCSIMEVLDLGSNELTDEFPSWLSCLNRLQVLALRRNHFYGSVTLTASQTGQMAFNLLQIIDISCNNLTGILEPEMFKILKAITKKNATDQAKVVGFRFLSNVYYEDTVAVTIKGVDIQMSKITSIVTAIDLSNNLFSGHIPEEIGILDGLYILNMSSNYFNGSIPKALGNLRQLESLDLSHNNLSGNIPYELLVLTFLSVLNLSFNNLQGRIPHGDQFSTFDATSFQGNPGLCGPPVKNNCTIYGHNNDSVIGGKKNQKLELEYIATGLGFGAGVALFAMLLLFLKNKRKWYCDHVDKVVVTLVFVPIDWFWSCYRKFKDDGAVKDDEFGDNEEDEGGEKLSRSNDSGRHFCVFCTQLERGATRAIHRECSCVSDNSMPIHPP